MSAGDGRCGTAVLCVHGSLLAGPGHAGVGTRHLPGSTGYQICPKDQCRLREGLRWPGLSGGWAAQH